MPSVAKITRVKVSERYRTGLLSLGRPLALISKAPGLIKSYTGYEVEDPAFLFWVNDWASKDDRDAFAKQPAHKEVADACQPVFASEPTVHYVEFEDTKGALSAPVTEFVTFTLKEGQSVTDLVRLIQQIHENLAGSLEFHGDSWGVVIDKPTVYYVILGWNSVEAHWAAVSSGRLKELIDQVKEIADWRVVHATLKPFSG